MNYHPPCCSPLTRLLHSCYLLLTFLQIDWLWWPNVHTAVLCFRKEIWESPHQRSKWAPIHCITLILRVLLYFSSRCPLFFWLHRDSCPSSTLHKQEASVSFGWEDSWRWRRGCYPSETQIYVWAWQVNLSSQSQSNTSLSPSHYFLSCSSHFPLLSYGIILMQHLRQWEETKRRWWYQWSQTDLAN